jgi:hypothetical protein
MMRSGRQARLGLVQECALCVALLSALKISTPTWYNCRQAGITTADSVSPRRVLQSSPGMIGVLPHYMGCFRGVSAALPRYPQENTMAVSQRRVLVVTQQGEGVCRCVHASEV